MHAPTRLPSRPLFSRLRRDTAALLATALLLPLLGVSAGAAKVIDLPELKRRQEMVRTLVKKVMPSTVALISEEAPAAGSGVIVSRDGLILTAAHVSGTAGDHMTVVLPDGREARAEVLGANRGIDAGMVKIIEPDGAEWPAVEIGSSGDLERGDWCVALGHPGGYELDRTPPVRLGRLLARGPAGFLVTDCTLVGGDSGGPLFDLQGRLIGIHSSIGESLSENRHAPTGGIQRDWDRLLAGDTWGRLGVPPGAPGDPDRPVMGVMLDREGRGGLEVTEVTPGSPAEEAGIQVGDTIAQIDGQVIAGYPSLLELLAERRPGQRIKVALKRGEEELEREVKLARAGDVRPQRGRDRDRGRDPGGDPRRDGGGGDAPEGATGGRPFLGLQLVDADGGGAAVVGVAQDEAADRAGVRIGDVITGAGDREVETAGDLVEAVAAKNPGEELELTIARRDESLKLTVKLGRRPAGE